MMVWALICLAALTAGCISITAAAQVTPAAQLNLLRGPKPQVAAPSPLLTTLKNTSLAAPQAAALQFADPQTAGRKPSMLLGQFTQSDEVQGAAYVPLAAVSRARLSVNAPTPTLPTPSNDPLPLPAAGIAAQAAGLAAPVEDLLVGSATLGGAKQDVSPIVRMVIPRMALDIAVVYVPFSVDTWLIDDLKWEVAWMGDTSWPGVGGNTGLAAHVDFTDGSRGPFWNLDELQAGDTIEVYTLQNRYIYTLRESKLVDERDLSVIAPTDSAQITMITCAGWDPARREYTQRLVVFADLAVVEPIQ